MILGDSSAQNRRHTLAWVAAQILLHSEKHAACFVKEFVDQLCHPKNDPAERKAMLIEEEPVILPDPWRNVFLAGIAEMIAQEAGIPVPEWANQPIRFLDSPLIFGGSKSSQQLAIAATPHAFARRNLFCGEVRLVTHRWTLLRARGFQAGKTEREIDMT